MRETPPPWGSSPREVLYFLPPVLRATGHEDVQMKRVGASLLAGKNKAHPDP